MAVDQRRAGRIWRTHQLFTWLAFLTLLIVTLILLGLGARFLRPQAMLVTLTGLTLAQVAVWLFSRRIVVLFTKCQPASGGERERLERLLHGFLPRANLAAPALYVSDMDKPNAFAFGSGLLGDSCVAVTRPLLDLLNDDELQAVLAHECGHLRARDTVLMLVVSVLISWANQAASRLAHIGRAALIVSLLIELATYVPKVVAKGIAQLRELGADCFSAMMLGSARPLVSALERLEQWHREQQKDEERAILRGSLDDLMLSHPDMSLRRSKLMELEPPTRSLP